MNGKIVEIITKIGLSGITLASLVILYLILSNDLTHFGKEISSVGEYIQKNTAVLTEVKGVVEANTKQSERMERVITNLEQRIR